MFYSMYRITLYAYGKRPVWNTRCDNLPPKKTKKKNHLNQNDFQIDSPPVVIDDGYGYAIVYLHHLWSWMQIKYETPLEPLFVNSLRIANCSAWLLCFRIKIHRFAYLWCKFSSSSSSSFSIHFQSATVTTCVWCIHTTHKIERAMHSIFIGSSLKGIILCEIKRNNQHSLTDRAQKVNIKIDT